MIWAKIGAVAYALWSLLHIVLGATRLADRAADGTLAEATGRLAQGHWTLFGCVRADLVLVQLEE